MRNTLAHDYLMEQSPNAIAHNTNSTAYAIKDTFASHVPASLIQWTSSMQGVSQLLEVDAENFAPYHQKADQYVRGYQKNIANIPEWQLMIEQYISRDLYVSCGAISAALHEASPNTQVDENAREQNFTDGVAKISDNMKQGNGVCADLTPIAAQFLQKKWYETTMISADLLQIDKQKNTEKNSKHAWILVRDKATGRYFSFDVNNPILEEDGIQPRLIPMHDGEAANLMAAQSTWPLEKTDLIKGEKRVTQVE